MKIDFLMIGAGQAATPLAKALAEAGRSVCVAERRHLGGSGVSFGCTPTKAAIASATLAKQARQAEALGLRISEVEVDFAAVISRARAMAQRGRDVLEDHFGDDGPALLRGEAKITGRTEDGFQVQVGNREVTARQIVLDTGTRSTVPPIEGLEQIEPLTAETWLEQSALPERLAIIGGGYIGLEMAQFYRRMGSAVTVVESGDAIAGQEDGEVSDRLCEVLEQDGIIFRLGAEARKIEAIPAGARLHLGDGREPVDVSHVFLAVGRTPNTDNMGLESIGVELDDHGIVVVDDRLSTTCRGIWAVGDIRVGPMFTHTAWDDFRILRSQLLGDGVRTRNRIVPYSIFTEPQLGRVGMTETQARRDGHAVRIARYEMSSNGRAREMGAEEGLIKVVIDDRSEHILGAAVLAAEGAELVHIYATAMNGGLSFRTIEDAIHIHPTLAEAIQSALATAD